MKKFTCDVVDCSCFEFHCYDYFNIVSKYRLALRLNKLFMYSDILCDIGSFRYSVASDVVQSKLSDVENDYLVKKIFSLKRRVEKKLTLK